MPNRRVFLAFSPKLLAQELNFRGWRGAGFSEPFFPAMYFVFCHHACVCAVFGAARVVVKRRMVKLSIFSHAVTSFVLWLRPCVFAHGTLP